MCVTVFIFSVSSFVDVVIIYSLELIVEISRIGWLEPTWAIRRAKFAELAAIVAAITNLAVFDQRVLSGFVVSDFFANCANIVTPNIYVWDASATWVTD